MNLATTNEQYIGEVANGDNPQNLKAQPTFLSKTFPTNRGLHFDINRDPNIQKQTNQGFANTVSRLVCKSESIDVKQPKLKTTDTLSSTCFPVKLNVKYFGENESKVRYYLMSNAHAVHNCVLGKDGRMEVNIYDRTGNLLKGKVVCLYKAGDLCLISLDEPNPEFEKYSIDFDPFVGKTLSEMQLPERGNGLKVMGFPMGYTNMTLTCGEVTCISSTPYQYCGVRGPTFTCSVPINPGNSGGPAMNADGSLAGIVFEGEDGRQLTNYIIPKEVAGSMIKRFKDAAAISIKQVYIINHRELDFTYQPSSDLENYNEHGIIKADGIVVNQVSQGVKNPVLQKYDLITKIDGHTVNRNGKILLNGMDMVDIESLLMFKDNENCHINVEVIRGNETKQLVVACSKSNHPISMALCGMYKDYVELGPLTIKYAELRDFMQDKGNGQASATVMNGSVISMMSDAMFNNLNDSGDRLIEISHIDGLKLTSIGLNDQFRGCQNFRIAKMNNKIVKCLADVLIEIDDAKKHTNGVILFEEKCGKMLTYNMVENDELSFYVDELNKRCGCGKNLQTSINFKDNNIVCKECSTPLCSYLLKTNDENINSKTSFGGVPIPLSEVLTKQINNDPALNAKANVPKYQVPIMKPSQSLPIHVPGMEVSIAAMSAENPTESEMNQTLQNLSVSKLQSSANLPQFGEVVFKGVSSGYLEDIFLTTAQVDGVDVETALS